MNLKKVIIVLLVIIIIISVSFLFYKYRNNKREDVKIPILLYHNFVSTVPETDPDNFNYINTPESFEENIKVILENICIPLWGIHKRNSKSAKE